MGESCLSAARSRLPGVECYDAQYRASRDRHFPAPLRFIFVGDVGRDRLAPLAVVGQPAGREACQRAFGRLSGVPLGGVVRVQPFDQDQW